MMIGGQQYPGKIGRTYLSDILTGEWTEGPKLEMARAFHSCGLFELNGKKWVLVIGGESQDGSYLTSVEYLDVAATIEDGWKPIAPLPSGLFDPVVVSLGNRLVVMGGTLEGYEESLDIYEFVCPRPNIWRGANGRGFEEKVD